MEEGPFYTVVKLRFYIHSSGGRVADMLVILTMCVGHDRTRTKQYSAGSGRGVYQDGNLFSISTGIQHQGSSSGSSRWMGKRRGCRINDTI